jgi:hypothetical protein
MSPVFILQNAKPEQCFHVSVTISPTSKFWNAPRMHGGKSLDSIYYYRSRPLQNYGAGMNLPHTSVFLCSEDLSSLHYYLNDILSTSIYFCFPSQTQHRFLPETIHISFQFPNYPSPKIENSSLHIIPSYNFFNLLQYRWLGSDQAN